LTQKQNELLASTQVDKLATQVEEATRATTDAPKRALLSLRVALWTAQNPVDIISFSAGVVLAKRHCCAKRVQT
jgi:hypothetical protein